MLSQRVLARTLGVDAKSVRIESAELVGDELEIRVRLIPHHPTEAQPSNWRK